MAQFAESGQISDISDVWPLDGIGDAFKKASTASDGKQYFVPVSYYPWAVFHRKSVFEKNGWTQPKTLDDLKALMTEMQGKKITPFAFAAKDAWAPMGTFDILNMRINGYDFHMELTKGKQKWDSAEVRKVFETWKTLLPFHQENSLGRTWQEAATSMAKGECGMYLLGTFVVDGVPTDAQEDLDFFTFPEIDSSIGSDALDAPIDGFCVAAGAKDQEAGKAFIKWLASAEAADAANNAASAPFIAANSAASTAKYGALQKKSVEVVQNAKSIAQFLDRDTNADLANTVITASLQDFIKNPGNIDSITTSIQQQAASILG
jgi:multiple sugar transport system substrate-binding protein